MWLITVKQNENLEKFPKNHVIDAIHVKHEHFLNYVCKMSVMGLKLNLCEAQKNLEPC